MMSISITINFQYQEPMELHSGCWSSFLKHWNLRSSCLSGQNKLEWMFLDARYMMPREEFLELVGENVKKAVQIIMSNSNFTLEEVKNFITPEVQSFYRQLEINTLESVEFHMVDQS